MTDPKDRPPYIRFERRPVEDRTASIAAGHYVTRDVDFVILMRAGSKDTVEKEVASFLDEWRKRATEGQIPMTWFEDAKRGYEFWLNGETLPERGTPIKGWQLVSPAQQANLIAAGIRTVEDLAELPDSMFISVGIGAQGLKQQAKSWLATAANTGSIAAENAAMKIQLATQSEQIAALMAQMASLKPKEKA